MASINEGESFYFFDFDDNLMFLETPIFIRHKTTKKRKALNTEDFASIRQQIGKFGEWEQYELYDETYSHFRDRSETDVAAGKSQYLVEDIEEALKHGEEKWQAPAWKLFQYACENQRPIAIITARGHSRETIIQGLEFLFNRNVISKRPNILQIYAVSNDEMINELIESISDITEQEFLTENRGSTSALKRIAIHNTVDLAVEKYGAGLCHRFGMSDDDPKNVDLIVKAMCDCKKKYMDMRFFVIDTHKGEHVKLEVFPIDFPVTGNSKQDLGLE